MNESLFQVGDLATAGKDEWLTPPHIIAELGPFDLDPCCPVVEPWPIAKNKFTCHDNGLIRPWEGFVWCNPPYSTAAKWLGRCAEYGNAIALVFARTETDSFFRNVWEQADAVLFIRGRLRFYHANGKVGEQPSPAPSVLVGYGKEAAARLCTATGSIKGRFIQLR